MPIVFCSRTRAYKNRVKFNKKTFNKPRPSWTKNGFDDRFKNSFEKLSNFICSRTPTRAYNGDEVKLYTSIVENNQEALGTWSYGYTLLFKKVKRKLIFRDGSL